MRVLMVPRWYGILWIEVGSGRVLKVKSEGVVKGGAVDLRRVAGGGGGEWGGWGECEELDGSGKDEGEALGTKNNVGEWDIIAPWDEDFPGALASIPPGTLRAVDESFDKDGNTLRNRAIKEAVKDVRAAFTDDMHIIQCSRAIEDLNHVINTLAERLREWHGYYLPGAFHVSKGLDMDLIGAIAEDPKYKGVGNEDPVARDMGAEFDDETFKVMEKWAKTIVNLDALKKDLERYLETKVEEVAPTMTASVGPKITAALISTAGGLANLADMPASKIQVIGAEKALFRHLKYGKKPPKHGIIFQHPWIHSAPKRSRGKVARAMAARIAIAARMDAYGRSVSDGEKKAFAEALRRKVESLVVIK